MKTKRLPDLRLVQQDCALGSTGGKPTIYYGWICDFGVAWGTDARGDDNPISPRSGPPEYSVCVFRPEVMVGNPQEIHADIVRALDSHFIGLDHENEREKKLAAEMKQDRDKV